MTSDCIKTCGLARMAFVHVLPSSSKGNDERKSWTLTGYCQQPDKAQSAEPRGQACWDHSKRRPHVLGMNRFGIPLKETIFGMV